jgi:hypothetical protein
VVATPGRGFDCVPAFCLVSTEDGAFVQRLDGTGRTALPGRGHFALLGPIGDGGLVVLPDRSLLDPVTGRHGIAEKGGEVCMSASGVLKGTAYFRWSGTDANGCTGRRAVFFRSLG